MSNRGRTRGFRWAPWRIPARLRCHGSVWCCQYQDKPMCNSWGDPHPLSRWRHRGQRLIDECGWQDKKWWQLTRADHRRAQEILERGEGRP